VIAQMLAEGKDANQILDRLIEEIEPHEGSANNLLPEELQLDTDGWRAPYAARGVRL
jgi:hypothetical protein